MGTIGERPLAWHHPAIARPRFEGYAAAPLASLIIQPYNRSDLAIARQLHAVGQRENFDVLIQTEEALYMHPQDVNADEDFTSGVWSQDHKFFLKKKNGTEVIRVLKAVYEEQAATVRELGEWLGLKAETAKTDLEGGNFFLGKRADGTPYALVGRESFNNTRDAVRSELRRKARIKKTPRPTPEQIDTTARQRIAKDLGLKPGQITYLSQPDFHIDLAVRPLSGNRVLLNDFSLGADMLNQAARLQPDAATRKQLAFLKKSMGEYRRFQKQKGYADSDTIARELEAGGFEVIRIPGVLRMPAGKYPGPASQAGRCVSYANAIVHRRDTGELVYITNASYLPVLDRLFEKTLKALAPEVAQVDWISGQRKPLKGTPFKTNAIASHLDLGGGVHCLSNERPDFSKF